jgi:DNA polymerase
MDKSSLLKLIRDELIDFQRSPLYEYRVKNGYYPVIGEGDHDAEVMFIGEAPGETEAKTARPFCGASGRILDQLLESIDLDRNDVYVTNVVKDRPPKNRDPKTEEIQLYTPFLTRQIDIIQPHIVATLGRFGMEFMFLNYQNELEVISKGKNAGKPKLPKISQARGQTYNLQTSEGTKFKLLPLYHPAVALYNPTSKDDLLKDFKVLQELIS